MGSVPYDDLLAGIVSIGLLVGILVLAVLGQAIPEFLTGSFGIAIGYVFRGVRQNGVAVARDIKNGITSEPGP